MAERELLDVEIGRRRFKTARMAFDTLATEMGTAFGALTGLAAREMKILFEDVRKEMEERHSTPWKAGVTLPKGERSGRLARRSGRRIKGLDFRVVRTTENVTGSVSVPFPLNVHEAGAIITKRSKLLAIPLPAALDSRGIPLKRKPRDWPNTFAATSKRGNLLVFQRRGRRIVPLYVLKERTRLPPRLGMRHTLIKAAPRYIEKMFVVAQAELQKRGL